MRKPANIILTLVGTAVAGGVGLSAVGRRAGWNSHSSYQSSGAQSAEQVIRAQEYQTDSYIPGVGYYHAPHHGWFPFRYNFFDGARGYFHGGQWTPSAEVAAMTSSTPTPEEIAKARELYKKEHLAGSYGRSSYHSSGYHSYGGSSYGGSVGHGSTSFSSSNGSGSHSSGVSGVSHGGFGGSSHSSSS